MQKKMIVCVSGGMIQTIRSNFDVNDVDVEVWDEDAEDYLREQFQIDDNMSIDTHWEKYIIKQYPNVVH